MENTKILTESQIEAINKLAEIVAELVDKIWDIVKRAAECIAKVWRAIIENYQNKRVVHLALHHGDIRVRKKNINRIIKWFRRWVHCKE